MSILKGGLIDTVHIKFVDELSAKKGRQRLFTGGDYFKYLHQKGAIIREG